MIKEEPLEKVKAARPAITVVGLGGAGCNIVTWISDKKLAGGRIIAANTEAAKENLAEIKEELKGTNLIFLVAGLGGGSGTGAMPVFARAG